MKIQYCSDLHLEFEQNKQFLMDNPLQVVGNVLLLAGDVVPFALLKKHTAFFDFIADHFEITYWIPGNHEYYGADLANHCGSFNEKIRSNIALVNNVSVDHGDVHFVFSTLWSHITPINQWNVQEALRDFHVIDYNGSTLTPYEFNRQHQLAVAFLMDELNQRRTSKTVVVTHHVPTFKNYPEKYKDDIVSEAFATELFDLVESSDASFWVYGHHHQPIPEFVIGTTRLVNNQLGYVKYGEHKGFNDSAVLNF